MSGDPPRIVSFLTPARTLPFSGERFTTVMTGGIDHEHRHRYLFALGFCRGRRVLDIACGEGYGAALLATEAAGVVGVDVDAATVAHASVAYPLPNLCFVAGDATAIPLADASVEVVVSFETIEHFAEHERFLAELRRVLVPGGLLVISSPIKENYGAEDWENPYHARELTQREFKALVSGCFRHAAWFEQKATAGSLIMPEQDAASAGVTSFRRLDAERFAVRPGGLDRPVYAIAVASDAPLPDGAAWGLLDDEDYVARQARIIAFNMDLIRRHEAALQEQAEQAQQREAELLQAREALVQKDVERVLRQWEISRQDAELGNREQVERELRQELDRQAEALRQGEAALQAARAELDNAVRQRDHHIEALLSSTSWRITAPLRAVRTRFAALADRAMLLRHLAEHARLHMRLNGVGGTLRAALRPDAPRKLSALVRRLRGSSQSYAIYGEPLSRPAPTLLPPRVLIVAELALAQCAKYRVWQKAAHFRTLGVDCTVVEWWRKDEVRNALQTHSIAIFYRTPGYPEMLGLIAEAKRLRVPTLWEVDDLIFDDKLYRANRNIDHLEPALRESVLAGVPLYRAALQACDHAIASTTALAEEMLRAGAERAFVVENALDAQTLEAAAAVRAARAARQPGTEVRIVYGSGSKAHDADFLCAAPALAEVMRENPEVVLHIVGELTLPAALEPYALRILRKPFTDYAGYLALLGEADISLAPLEATRFNDAKSNIKFLEAAILGLPSVCSPREAFRGAVEHGANGFLAETTQEWHAALTGLVRDPALRARIGAGALATAEARYAPHVVACSQVAAIVAHFGRPQPKLRVLTANIFFAPQSFGGATIVAEQLAMRLAARDDTELAVFTSWGEPTAAAHALHRFEGKGVPCFGVKLPSGGERELDHDNPGIAQAFREVLAAFRPDVVHLHSIQGLGATIALACRDAGIPYVITVHDAWWLCERQFMVRADGQYCFQQRIDLSVCAACVPDLRFTTRRRDMLREVLDGASLLLAPSAFQRGLYVSNGLPGPRVVVNRNGVRVPAAAPVRRIDRPLRFGFVGGIGPLKGSGLILAAFRDLPQTEYELVIVDNTLNLGFSSVRPEEVEVPGTVRIVPAYTQDTMDAFFAGIDVLLFPSQGKESFGLTVREALARNVWVIVTDSGGTAEDVVEGENGNIIPMGPDHAPLREAIAALLADPARLDRHENPHRDRIATFDNQAAELHAVLRSVAAAPLPQNAPAAADAA